MGEILERSLHLFALCGFRESGNHLGIAEDQSSSDEHRSGKCSTRADFGTGSVLCLDEGSWKVFVL